MSIYVVALAVLARAQVNASPKRDLTLVIDRPIPKVEQVFDPRLTPDLKEFEKTWKLEELHIDGHLFLFERSALRPKDLETQLAVLTDLEGCDLGKPIKMADLHQGTADLIRGIIEQYRGSVPAEAFQPDFKVRFFPVGSIRLVSERHATNAILLPPSSDRNAPDLLTMGTVPNKPPVVTTSEEGSEVDHLGFYFQQGLLIDEKLKRSNEALLQIRKSVDELSGQIEEKGKKVIAKVFEREKAFFGNIETYTNASVESMPANLKTLIAKDVREIARLSGTMRADEVDAFLKEAHIASFLPVLQMAYMIQPKEGPRKTFSVSVYSLRPRR